MNDSFKVGDFIIYVNGNSYELGRIKSLRERGAYVYYHEGDTATLTPYDYMHTLLNAYTITKSTLGCPII